MINKWWFTQVNRQTVLCGSQNIVLHGKVIVEKGAIVRGDLANVRTGRYCIISKNSVIRPPFKQFSKGVAFFPLHIGDHVFIGENSVISAASIGSYVYIGKNVVIVSKTCLVSCYNVLMASTFLGSQMRFKRLLDNWRWCCVTSRNDSCEFHEIH